MTTVIPRSDRMVLSFERFERYTHRPLVKRIQAKMNLDKTSAEQLFYDLKQFLYLCARYPGHLTPSRPIDEAWHQFILYTRDYRSFCIDYCGRFVDHQPFDEEQKLANTGAFTRTLSLARQEFGDPLSWNWQDTAECEPNTACQDPPPADCSKND